MYYPFLLRAILLAVALLPCLFLPLASQVRGASDSANHPAYFFDRLREEVLFIDQMDFDAHPDTVFGRHVGLNDYMISSIAWGTAANDTANRGRGRRDTTLVSRTRIVYPRAWRNIRPSFSIMALNQDSAQDILLFLGYAQTDSSQRPPLTTDTMRIFRILGQDSLKHLPFIFLDSVALNRRQAFAGRQLTFSGDFIEPKVRDLSGATSYEILRLSSSMRNPDTARQENHNLDVPNHVVDGSIGIFPNPTANEATIVLSGFPVGEYRVEVYGLNGLRCCEQFVTVKPTDKGILRTLDLHSLPSGLYFVRAFSRSTLFSVRNIVVVR